MKNKKTDQQMPTENTTTLLALLNKMGVRHKYGTYTLRVDGVWRRVTCLTLLDYLSDTDGCPLELYIYNDRVVKDVRCFPVVEYFYSK